jgi:polysaccharide export outer membrane protein
MSPVADKMHLHPLKVRFITDKMMTQRLTFALLFAGICTFSLQGQATLQMRTHAPPAVYVLGPGDEVIVQVSDSDEIGNKPVRIDPNGFVDLPLAGRLQAQGLTLEQFKAALSDRLSRYITHPEVTVNLAESESQPVSVIGQVNAPGVHQLDGSKRLLEVLSLSGGLKPDAGAIIIVTRDPRYGVLPGDNVKHDVNGYTTRTLSVDALMSSTHPEDNIPVEPNDVISVPRAELIYVLGDVKRAGGFPLTTHPSISLLQALSLAEGTGPDNSAKNSRILRQAPGGDGVVHEIPVDIPKIIAGKAPDVQLLANDVLFVPHSGVKVTSRRVTEAALGITTGLLIYR